MSVLGLLLIVGSVAALLFVARELRDASAAVNRALNDDPYELAEAVGVMTDGPHDDDPAAAARTWADEIALLERTFSAPAYGEDR